MEEREVYPRNLFDPTKVTELEWLKENKFLVDQPPPDDLEGTKNYEEHALACLEFANRKRMDIEKNFAPKMKHHFKTAIEICKITVPPFGPKNRGRRYGELYVARSMAMDSSEDNIKKFCWIMYNSCSAPYKGVFGVDMCKYFEDICMSELGVVYGDSSDDDAQKEAEKKRKGCVQKCLGLEINKYRCNARDNMSKNAECEISNIQANVPTNWKKDKPKPKDRDRLFWVGKKDRNVVVPADASEEEKRKLQQKLVWSHVSDCVVGMHVLEIVPGFAGLTHLLSLRLITQMTRTGRCGVTRCRCT